jgi:hypothetical protein
MATMARHQNEFSGWSNRNFEPDKKRQEPVLWLKNLWVLKEFSPNAILKEFKLRPGLNIMWSKAFDGEVSLGQSGLSGHAAGKSTFCRLIRYVLGERHLGTAELREALCFKFPNVVVVGVVRLAGADWVVCRSPGLAKKSFVKKSDSLEALFDPKIEELKLADFLSAIDDAVLPGIASEKLPGRKLDASWQYILPWLSRDQECRYSRVLGWRSSDSEAEAPQTSAIDSAYLVRSVVGLVSDEEEAASAVHENLKGRERELAELLPKVEYRAKTDKERISEAVTRIEGLTGELFYDALIGRIDLELANYIGTRIELPEVSVLEETEDEIDQLQRELMKCESDLSDARRDLVHQQTHLNALRQRGQDETDEKWKNEGGNSDDGKCGVPLAIALKTCRLAQQYNSLDFNSSKALASVEEQVHMWEEQILSLKERVNSQEQVLDQTRRNLEQAKEARIKARIQLRDAESNSASRIESLRATRDLVVQLQRSDELLVDTSDELETVRKNCRASSAELDKLRRSLKSQLSDLSSLFECILKAVLGKQVKASISPMAETIKLSVEYDGSRTSAATETIKLLAFDLACMLFSVEGKGGHPRFLIHDSPREADMSRDIYHRFFLYMRQMEERFGPNTLPNYQYIVTTTEQPPEAMCDSPWLISMLDASHPTGRLLGVNL